MIDYVPHLLVNHINIFWVDMKRRFGENLTKINIFFDSWFIIVLPPIIFTRRAENQDYKKLTQALHSPIYYAKLSVIN